MTSPSPSQAGRLLTSPYLILLVPPLCWAGNAIIGRIAMADTGPFALNFWRWMVALLVLVPFTAPRVVAEWEAVRRTLARMMVLGTLSVGLFNALLYASLQTTEAINATLVGAVMPLAIMSLSLVLLREPFGLWRSLGLVASMAGVVLVIARGDIDRLLALELHRGDVLMLVAVASWALFSVLLRRWPLGLSTRTFLTMQIACGLVPSGLLYAIETATGGAGVPLTWQSGGIVLFTALFPALAAFVAWNYGVKMAGAAAAGFYINLVPVFTALAAVALLGETFAWYHGAGLGMIFVGIALSARKPAAAH